MFGQQHKIDSLNNVLQRTGQDTVRVNLLLNLARAMYGTGQYNDEVAFALEAKNLSQKLGYKKGEGESWTTLGHVAMRQGAYDSALSHLDHATALFTSIQNYRRLANVHLFKGQVNDYQAKYTVALDHYKTALTLIESYADDAIKFKILNSMGITYFNRGSYETALGYYMDALKVCEKFDNKLYYASVLNNIGVVNMSVLQYDAALEYFQKYLRTMRDLGHTQFIAVALLNVGEVYMKKRSYESAIQYLDSALVTYRQVDEKRGMALAHGNLGECYFLRKDFVRAERHFNQAIEIAEAIKSEEALLKGLLGAAELYIKMDQREKAARHLDRAHQIAKRTGSMLWLEKTYLFNAKLDSVRKNYEGAYGWFKAYSALNDSLFNERKSQQVLQMRELYESEKKDKEILLLSEAKKMEALKASSNQKLLIISAIFFIAIIMAILYWLTVKSRHSTVLEEQHTKITEAYKELKLLVDKVEEQNKSLAQKNEALEELHREKDGLIGVVAHDLRAPLNRISGLVHLLSFNPQLTRDDKELITIIEKVCTQGNGLIRDLLEINQYENSQVVEVSTIDLVAQAKKMSAHFGASLMQKNIRFAIDTPAEVSISSNASYLDRILDNLITNAIKFSPAGKEVQLRVVRKEESVDIIVADQGQGFHPDDLPHLFRKFKKLSARPTAGESSTGLGLSIVKTLVEKIGGTVRIDSEWGKGAAVTITLPLHFKFQPVMLAS
ncbi:tetratricopeptide repeat-containing sensor histidine kinase [Pseudochryseolinea flava]|nr:tetratricopeptide repeat protein [Pseudochryseolinea flava]